jgi:polyphosphate kinase
MFFYTDTADAPWTVVKSDDKRRARLATMQHFLHQLPYTDKSMEIVQTPDPRILGPASHLIGENHHMFGESLAERLGAFDSYPLAPGRSRK